MSIRLKLHRLRLAKSSRQCRLVANKNWWVSVRDVWLPSRKGNIRIVCHCNSRNTLKYWYIMFLFHICSSPCSLVEMAELEMKHAKAQYEFLRQSVISLRELAWSTFDGIYPRTQTTIHTFRWIVIFFHYILLLWIFFFLFIHCIIIISNSTTQISNDKKRELLEEFRELNSFSHNQIWIHTYYILS